MSLIDYIRAKKYVNKNRFGNKAIAIGDSITNGQDTSITSESEITLGDGSWFNQLCILSKQQIQYLRNSGINGNTTTQMRARLQSDVLEHNPDVLFIFGGTNDYGDGVTNAETFDNLTYIHKAAEQRGVKVIFCTIPPRGSTPIAETLKINAWIKDYCARNKLNVVDFYKILTNPADGSWITEYAADTTHPNDLGANYMADFAWQEIGHLFPAHPPNIAYSNVEPNNLFSNGLFLTDSDADGLADGWTVGGTGSYTPTLISDTEGHGNLQEINRTVSDANITSLANVISSGFSVGDRIAVIGRLQTVIDDVNTPLNYRMETRFRDSSAVTIASSFILSDYEVEVNDGVFYYELTVPANTASIRTDIRISGGTGKFRIGQMTIRNLTTQFN